MTTKTNTNKKRLLAAGWLSLCLVQAAADSQLLWEIGRRDGQNAEFALAPGRYRDFRDDGLFVVGRSNSKRDWPYVHPGPHDSWAGGKEHTFAIVFGLKNAPGEGECRLKLAFVDTQGQAPSQLRVTINSSTFELRLPAGGGDESVQGQPGKGKPCAREVAFPASLLVVGNNEIGITTHSGSWVLYDWLGLETPNAMELAPAAATGVLTVKPFPAIFEKNGRSYQAVQVGIRHFGEESSATVQVGESEPVVLKLRAGAQTCEVPVPAVTQPQEVAVRIEQDGQLLAARKITIKPVPRRTVYILPHSHTDIGYTEIQTAIEKKQVNNLLQGIEYARKTAEYPPGARFVWNVEVVWAADLYLNRLSEAQKRDFFQAVKKGQVSLNGMYLNELTGLCRPEELIRLFRYSTQLSEQTGVSIDSAMISDVPGYTWATVTAMAQAGIKYFSTAPNYFDRIGDILVQWENKPFYWSSPSGREKVLVWIPYKGYAMSHIINKLTEQFVGDYQAQLDQSGYPYEIAHMRWSGHGDNAVPDPAICEFVKEWSAKYSWPKFIISSTSEAFQAFEKRYGSQLPVVRGDWTPYWEDGAGSSALETGMNRASSDRLSQAESLWAMRNPGGFSANAFEEAWRQVLLYSEHTWGAWCSVSEPERKETREQWEIKRSYALQADERSRTRLAEALRQKRNNPAGTDALEVINTTSWQRTELVTLTGRQSAAGDRITDDQGKVLPSQRLAGGELVFLARDVPPFASRCYQVSPGTAGLNDQAAQAAENSLENGLIRLKLDAQTGGIVELFARDLANNFVDASSGQALNEYLYLIGDQLSDLKKNGPVKITVKERGPLVASLVVESPAPGCNKLVREIRLVAGLDYVELFNCVDKQRLAAKSYMAKNGKESVNFGFPFHVPKGEMWLDLPLGAIRPDQDLLPSACKNWFTVGRWADVSNPDFGITWVTLDAPLVEVGGLTANLLNSQTNPKVWRNKVEKTQKIYSWAMNNHWGTNYRAYQEGPTWFRFVLRPHRAANPADASRMATAFSQPLLVSEASGLPTQTSRLRLSSQDVIITGMKPSDDGRALILRLFGAAGKDVQTTIHWSDPVPQQLWMSDTSEKPLGKITGEIFVPAWGLVTIRAELPAKP